jgi:hypothetical protein
VDPSHLATFKVPMGGWGEFPGGPPLTIWGDLQKTTNKELRVPLRSPHAVQEVTWTVNVHTYPNARIVTLAMWESGAGPTRRLNFSHSILKPVDPAVADHWAAVVGSLIADRISAMWGASDELPLGDF